VDSSEDATAAWYWEGNVVDALAHYLKSCGWNVLSKADTQLRERGVDLRANNGDRLLLVEAKGFPSKIYRDPRRIGEQKPTNPNSQAQQWSRCLANGEQPEQGPSRWESLRSGLLATAARSPPKTGHVPNRLSFVTS
jgi:hypothetical protein